MRLTTTRIFSLSFLCSALLLLNSCGGEEGEHTDTGVGETTFQGAIAFSSGDNGTLSIDIPSELARLNNRTQSSGNQSITGECVFPGGTVPLEGSINSSSGEFTLTGDTYTFAGTFNFTDGTFTGNLSQNGSDAGTFSGVDSTGATVQLFCGTFTSDGDSGVFVVVVTNDTVTGNYAGTNSSGTLTGTRDGDNFTVNSSEGGSAVGSVDGDSASGVILNESGDENGVFEGDTASCAS